MATRTRSTRAVRRGAETFGAEITFTDAEAEDFDGVTVEVEPHASIELGDDGVLTITATQDDTAEWDAPVHRLSIYLSADDERVERLILEVPTR
jgi:hypothetical protein